MNSSILINFSSIFNKFLSLFFFIIYSTEKQLDGAIENTHNMHNDQKQNETTPLPVNSFIIVKT